MDILLCVDAIQMPLTGIGRYTYELATRLHNIKEIDDLRYYHKGKWKKHPNELLIPNQELLNSLIKKSSFKKPLRWLYRYYSEFKFANASFRSSTLLHAPNYIAPQASCPTIITIHDLSHIRYPEFHPEERVHFLTKYLPSNIKKAAHIITISDFTKQELISLFGVNDKKITTIHLAASASFQPFAPNHCFSTLKKYNLNYGKYLLSVATLEPRKNLITVLNTYAQLPATIKCNYPLVLVGGMGWKNEEIVNVVNKLRQQGCLKQLGYVNEIDLPFLYAGATGFIYLSFYEGFGLPILEAMASGIPVITSNCSSMPEVAGGAALLAEPQDVNGIRLGIERLIDDHAWRLQSREAGIKRAQQFTWDKCVNETANLYRQVINETHTM